MLELSHSTYIILTRQLVSCGLENSLCLPGSRLRLLQQIYKLLDLCFSGHSGCLAPQLVFLASLEVKAQAKGVSATRFLPNLSTQSSVTFTVTAASSTVANAEWKSCSAFCLKRASFDS